MGEYQEQFDRSLSNIEGFWAKAAEQMDGSRGPSFTTAIVAILFPENRPGAILSGTMRKIADGGSYKVPASIDNPKILLKISCRLRAYGTRYR